MRAALLSVLGAAATPVWAADSQSTWMHQVSAQLKAIYLKSAEPLEFNLVAVGVTAVVTLFLLYQVRF
jgi:flagellar basal body-associated protein FliL